MKKMFIQTIAAAVVILLRTQHLPSKRYTQKYHKLGKEPQA